MTSIEWFIYELEKVNYHPTEAMVMYAKKLHKQEIIKAFDEGQEYEYQYHINNAPKFDSETYYNETFVNKQSNDKSDFEKPFIDFAKQYVEQLKCKGNDSKSKN